MKLRHAAKLAILAALLVACGAQERKRAEVPAGCPSTRPDNPAGYHGDVVGIQIILPGSGKILAVPEGVMPDGDHLVTESIDADGAISIKFPVWTGEDTSRRLRITGASLDGHEGRVRGEHARAPRDFHPGYLEFPSEGCWRVSAWSGAASLTFVIDVVDCVRRECAEV